VSNINTFSSPFVTGIKKFVISIMRRLLKQKASRLFIGNPAFLPAGYLLNIFSSKPSFNPLPPFGFFPDLLNKFGEKSTKTV